MSPKAMRIIEDAIGPLIKNGSRIERLKMNVSWKSELAEMDSVNTKFGLLKIVANGHLERGCCYVMEDDTSMKGRGFAWIAKPAEEKKKSPGILSRPGSNLK